MADRRAVVPVVAVMGFVMLATSALVFVTVPRFSPLHESATWEELASKETTKDSVPVHTAKVAKVALQADSKEQKTPPSEKAKTAHKSVVHKANRKVVQDKSVPKKAELASTKTTAAQSAKAAKAAKESAVNQARKLSDRVKSSVKQLQHFNVPGVSKHSDAQLDEMAEVYFRKLNDKKNNKKVMKMVKHKATAVHPEDKKPAASKVHVSTKATKQKLAEKAADKKQDQALDKEAEKFYQQYQKKKSHLEKLHRRTVDKKAEKKAKIEKKAINKVETKEELKEIAKEQNAKKLKEKKLAKQKAKLAAEKEDKQMDIEAEKLYHSYVKKKQDKLKAVREQQMKAEKKKATLQKKATEEAKKTPVHKKLIESDAKLDKTAEADYEKFVKHKQAKLKATQQLHKTVKKDVTSATKTEAKVEKKAKKLDDHHLDKTAEKDYKLFQRLREHKAKLMKAKKAALQETKHNSAEHKRINKLEQFLKKRDVKKLNKPATQKMKSVKTEKSNKSEKPALKGDAKRDSMAKALYKQMEKEKAIKAKLVHSQTEKKQVSDEEQAEKKMHQPDLKKMKPMKPAQLHQLEEVEVKKLREMKKYAPKVAPAKKSSRSEMQTKPLNHHQLQHLVSIEHKLDDKAHKLGMNINQAKAKVHAKKELKPLNRKQLSQLEQSMHPKLHKIPADGHEKTLPHIPPPAHRSPSEHQKLLAKAATKPLSPTELAKLEHTHMTVHHKAAKTQLSEVTAKVTSSQHLSEKEEIQKAVKRGRPMSAKQLSQLEDLHDKTIRGAAKMRSKLSVKNVMEKADETQLALTSSHHSSSYQGRQGVKRTSHALARLKQPKHSLGIAKLLEGGGIKKEFGTQELVQTSLTELPDDFIPKDSPAYQMIMQARMAAQQEELAVQNHVVAEGAAKNAYNDKMKRLDEKNMLADDKPRLTMLDEEEEFSGDSLAGDEDSGEDEGSETMLAQRDAAPVAEDGKFDSLASDFDSLAEDDEERQLEEVQQ
jgi:hypothetical protein